MIFKDRMQGDWETRLRHVVDTLREMSLYTDPQEVVRIYQEGVGQKMGWDHMVSLTRRGVEPPKYIVARSSRWRRQPNPWEERDQLPVFEGGDLGAFLYEGEPRIIDDYTPNPRDPAHALLEGTRVARGNSPL